MDISLRWINRYLDPGDVGADELDAILTSAGFPIETRTDLPAGDVRFDVEITSNRGDCLSHIGLAREIAASRQGTHPRRLVKPQLKHPARSGSVRDHLSLTNEAPDLCPRFTAQVIRGVKVGPSPAWLVELLEALGQRSINNIVDVTNWLTFEYGQPSHVFDLDTLAGPALVVRHARKGETLRTLDGVDRTLDPADLVVADAERAQSLAGVIGGEPTEVTDATTNVVLEVACWDPVVVRTMARRFNIRTDASHRFERGVDPRTLDEPAQRAAELILELAGGTLCEGILDEGPPPPTKTLVDLRPARAQRIIGVPVTSEQCQALLRPLEIETQPSDDHLQCTIPPFRLDLTREIDLIEEVARTLGYDEIPLHERLEVRVAHPQESERALAEINRVLTACGFYETVTFSFTSPKHAEPFVAPGLQTVAVDDERRGGEPILRPSPLTGLLTCRKANQDALVQVAGGVRLFERAAAFAQDEAQASHEHQALCLLMDVPGEGTRRSFEDRQHAWRILRGSLECLVRTLAGSRARILVEPARPYRPCWSDQAYARVAVEVESHRGDLGQMGMLAEKVLRLWDLQIPVLACELRLDALLALYPPKAHASPLPSFPAIERDLSIVVDEDTTWSTIEQLVRSASIDRLEQASFVGTYRGKQVPPGRKSVTFRMRFRDPSRTLRHEEVDPQVEALIARLRHDLEAEVRGA